jgi:hypothetical protein
MIPLDGGISMWQTHLIRQAPPPVAPLSQPPPGRVSASTPAGVERFLWDRLGLPRGPPA